MSEKLTGRLAELRSGLAQKKLTILATLSGAQIEKETGSLCISYFNNRVTVSFPELMISDAKTGTKLSEANQLLILYYLNYADGTPLEGRWIAFSELRDGRFYNQAFQGYTGKELAKYFNNEIDAFDRAGQFLEGVKIAYGDRGFAFHILPRVMLSVIYHLGDEEFHPNCQILFDASSNHYLPTDACAVLGSMLTQKLLSANQIF